MEPFRIPLVLKAFKGFSHSMLSQKVANEVINCFGVFCHPWRFFAWDRFFQECGVCGEVLLLDGEHLHNITKRLG